MLEPTFGLGRHVLAVIAKAYTEDELGGETRVVSQVSAAARTHQSRGVPAAEKQARACRQGARGVFELSKKRSRKSSWDDNGNIGKRYRRQDEIGTPFCITVDFDTLGETPNNDTVTVRHRDTGEQERMRRRELAASCSEKISSRCAKIVRMSDKDINVHITSGTIIKTLLFLVWCGASVVSARHRAYRPHGDCYRLGDRAGHAVFHAPSGSTALLAVISCTLIVGGVFFSILFFFVPPILNDAANFLSTLPATLSTLNISDVTHGLLPWGNVNTRLLRRPLAQHLHDAQPTPPAASSPRSRHSSAASPHSCSSSSSRFISRCKKRASTTSCASSRPTEYQAYVLNLWKRSQDKIGKWMQGQLVLAVIVGVLLYLGLIILGMPYALLLAVWPASSSSSRSSGKYLRRYPASLLRFANGGVTEAILVGGLYLVVQQFEANLIYPVVVKKVVGVPPLLVIFALLIGFKLFGFLGVLLSVPIAGAVQELVADIEKRKARALARDAKAKSRSTYGRKKFYLTTPFSIPTRSSNGARVYHDASEFRALPQAHGGQDVFSNGLGREHAEDGRRGRQRRQSRSKWHFSTTS